MTLMAANQPQQQPLPMPTFTPTPTSITTAQPDELRGSQVPPASPTSVHQAQTPATESTDPRAPTPTPSAAKAAPSQRLDSQQDSQRTVHEAAGQVSRLTLQNPAIKVNGGASTSASSTPSLPAPASAVPPRPLLSRQLQFKSSSAIPTLTSTSITSSGATTPTRRFTGLLTKSVPSSRRASMAGGDLHTAADLLRQAMMNGNKSTADDDYNDQVGSNSSTPPGAATPRPDLTDKRLPGLINSYFGQSTPPQTPRTSSHDGRAPTSNATIAAITSSTSTAPTTPSKLSRITSHAGPTVGPVIGKLSVEISQGRGLRPSTDPYCVCQFQWAEYISSGPTKKKNSHRNSHDGHLDKPRLASIPMKRTESEKAGPRAIPMSSRQSSQSGRDSRTGHELVADPRWEHKALFDVMGEHAELDVSVYDRANNEAFLGHVRLCPNLVERDAPYDCWLPLEPREGAEEGVISGEIHLRINFQKTEKRHYGPEDFQILKLIGKGTFGQVFQVRKKDTGQIYAMKVLSKKVIVQKKEVAHTLGERNILVRTAMTESPFIVGLKFSFQTPTDLYLVTDYMSGGELFWHLQKEGRFQEARAKFYIAELILALQHLHEHDIVYRDLKPENILLDANGHIALCDFGLSKANLADSDTTNTFCGTTEYLAPEVLLDEHGYTKMVDFWSLGVLVFEMCCGWSPFYAEDTQQMYKNIAFGKVRFPRDALSTEGRNFVKGLLNRNPRHRLGAQGDAEELKKHPFFEDIDWDALGKKNVVPPFKPKLKGKLDTSNFDPEFTSALENGAGSLNARAQALASGINPASTPLSPTVQANFKGFTFVDESAMERHFGGSDDDEGGERMDEDDDDDWEKVDSSNGGGRGNRMSGIVPTSPNEETVFHGQGFDV